MKVEVEIEWIGVGRVELDAAGRLTFPSGLQRVASIYWFRLTGFGSTRHYIGEADDLVRRMAGYRGGYTGQRTNARLNAVMHDHLDRGGHVEMAIATSGTVTVDGARQALNLTRKASRLLAEAAALHAVPAGEPIENLPGIGDRAEA